MSRYEALASGYDALMADGAYASRTEYLEACFRRADIKVERVLDLACGTGTIACLLAARGYDVTATDASEEMLTQAMRKAAELEKPPLFLLQSMPKLHLIEPVDAAVSTLDSINYLTRTRDLHATFRRVFRYLRAGGIFVFDVNTPYKLRRMDGELYTDEDEDNFCVWRTFFRERDRVCTYQVDLFRRRRDGAWGRDWEEHRERAWSEEELRQALAAAGFEKIRITGDLTARAARQDDDRWIVSCRKPTEKGRKKHG